MRFTAACITASALVATAVAAPAPECNADQAPKEYNQHGRGYDISRVGRPGRPGRRVHAEHPTTAATLTFPATCTAVVTSIATETVRVTETYSYTVEPTSTSSPEYPSEDYNDCVTDEEADQMAEVFRQLIQDYSDDVALSALTEDFVDYASAVNILMNRGAQFPKNITGPTFDGRQAFMDGQGSQPKIPFERLNTFHGCRSVTVRWTTSRSANGQPTEQAMIVSSTNAPCSKMKTNH